MGENKNYFYESYPEGLKEIGVISNEMEISFKEQRFFTTIILCGAINERLLTEKLIGHSKVLCSNIWQPGWRFFVDNKGSLLEEKKGKKEEFVRKIEVNMHGNLLNWSQIKSLFDIDIPLYKKLQLSKMAGIGEEEKKMERIHKLRIKYFHPFKLPDLNMLQKDAEEVRKLTRELLKDFYGVPITE